MASVKHPYMPHGLVLPGFVPNVLAYETILGVFFGCSALVVLIMFIITGRYKYLTTTERLLAGWWMCTGIIHFIIEGVLVAADTCSYKTYRHATRAGNVVVNSKYYQDNTGNILNEICK
ncbi:hypothetical protein Vretimale_2742 [Volvox reticuliferus]|uniref:Uncharacterized protein n=1 Tax=Volvox reticuliferus TaxID=1737510 RepID=A0A8J4BZT8_9CHLO|nr:hypothetical protein Vretifemale_1946 [Volvox reticuliferus]GIL97029.1 hypothetical protein Vretimale_2742 [Volvox reticuliferus]